MHMNITRWSPDTCKCIIELLTDNGAQYFLLQNEVCDDHAHMILPQRHVQHDELSVNVRNIIEIIKKRNIDTAVARFEEPRIARSRKLKKELTQCIELIKAHNGEITEEWAELVEQDHAFHPHIHAAVNEENQRKNIVQNHFAEHFGQDEPFSWTFSSGSPRVLNVIVPRDHEAFRAKIGIDNVVISTGIWEEKH